MLSILRHSILPARREVFAARALWTAAPLLKEAGKVGRPRKVNTDGTPATPKPRAKKAEKPKKPKLADADVPPKRPVSAYAAFFKEWFEEHAPALRERGKLDVTELSRVIGAAWTNLQTLNPAKVEEMQARAKAELAAYDKVYRDWFFARTPAERANIEKISGRRLVFPGGRANFRRDLRNRPGNPGRPSSSFFEFLRSLTPEFKDHPDVVGKPGIRGHQAMAKLASERWRAMAPEEKAKWQEITNDRKAKFDEWFKTQAEAGPQK
ncbi:hypothetical protein CC85DRAFT_326920 [Cutaneotrichosporon oleaginosum]|uniref:HMG box domain-containing protein n=1 Tax=Cutaneotrichosporon oleaginosum TaxID=879819 RepID=A0A0J0XSJ7_9TREE|nr:uncharacterized protein CC85DRAFT_326920 [Cutaneotrichosporon oleaginosum]KLT44025.1 hypothetical protein CC85DRAFT_326920 [Cutaneotrichosporon oleaginosum]TXT04029.1 hypothetical protein COLE_07726 [Cutaneotrichosporon oleaginosum]